MNRHIVYRLLQVLGGALVGTAGFVWLTLDPAHGPAAVTVLAAGLLAVWLA